MLGSVATSVVNRLTAWATSGDGRVCGRWSDYVNAGSRALRVADGCRVAAAARTYALAADGPRT